MSISLKKRGLDSSEYIELIKIFTLALEKHKDYMNSLNDQMKELNKNSRDQDKKLSNFLSTQINTQSNMMQLTNQLSKDGLIDKKTKKYFENIDKGIQQLLSTSKKK